MICLIVVRRIISWQGVSSLGKKARDVAERWFRRAAVESHQSWELLLQKVLEYGVQWASASAPGSQHWWSRLSWALPKDPATLTDNVNRHCYEPLRGNSPGPELRFLKKGAFVESQWPNLPCWWALALTLTGRAEQHLIEFKCRADSIEEKAWALVAGMGLYACSGPY